MNYSHILRNYDLKVTPQREAIVQELYTCGHLNIDQLYSKLLVKFPSISLATIYKNMNAMVEKIFVQEVKLPHIKAVYELSKESHAHFVCESCQHIEDIHIELKEVIHEVKQQTQYLIHSTSVVFNGKCLACSNT